MASQVARLRFYRTLAVIFVADVTTFRYYFLVYPRHSRAVNGYSALHSLKYCLSSQKKGSGVNTPTFRPATTRSRLSSVCRTSRREKRVRHLH